VSERAGDERARSAAADGDDRLRGEMPALVAASGNSGTSTAVGGPGGGDELPWRGPAAAASEAAPMGLAPGAAGAVAAGVPEVCPFLLRVIIVLSNEELR
jgi:hypothetical protein